MKKNLFFLLLFGSIFLLGQSNSSDPDKNFEYLYSQLQKLEAKNPALLIEKADSLFDVYESDEYRFKILAAKARGYAALVEIDEFLECSKKALKFSKNAGNDFWEAKLSLSIARPLINMELISEAEKYMKDALVASSKIKEKKERLPILVEYNILKALAVWGDIDKGGASALPYLYKNEHLIKVTQGCDSLFKAPFLAENEYYIAEAHVELGNNDSAFYYYSSALKNIKSLPSPDARYLAVFELGVENTRPKKEQESLRNKANELIAVAQETNNNFLLSKGYAALTETEASHQNLSKVIESTSLMFKEVSAAGNIYLNSVERENQLMSLFTKLLALAFFTLLLILLFIYLKYKRRRKEERMRYSELLKSISETREVPEKPYQEESNVMSEESNPKEEKTILPSERTGREILCKLSKFEKGTKYLDKNISLPALAAYSNTNTRYLSHIINKEKHKSFNEYIHSLRINYIVTKLTEEPQYLGYKINALADEAGFSSHSKFSEAFKKIVGMNPSTFIEFLQEEKQKPQQLSHVS